MACRMRRKQPADVPWRHVGWLPSLRWVFYRAPKFVESPLTVSNVNP
jgi:hypothetical protein